MRPAVSVSRVWPTLHAPRRISMSGAERRKWLTGRCKHRIDPASSRSTSLSYTVLQSTYRPGIEVERIVVGLCKVVPLKHVLFSSCFSYSLLSSVAFLCLPLLSVVFRCYPLSPVATRCLPLPPVACRWSCVRLLWFAWACF